MTLVHYRIWLGLIITTLSGVGVFVLDSGSPIDIEETLRDAIMANIASSGIHMRPDKRWVIPKIQIPIETITSKRYLDTLNRVIIDKLKESIGTGVTIDPSYASYLDITLEGSDFEFHLGSNEPIRIATSSFFFDLYHTRPISTVSGEVVPIWQKIIALTFDDGPSELYTNTLLDMLHSEWVHATFYVLGRNAERYPDILRREQREWHEIGNHSYSHTVFTKLGSGQIRDELYMTDQAIYRAIWEYPSTFRPPYGAVNTGMLMEISMPFVLWSIDTRDWHTHNMIKNIAGLAHAKSGDILVMHDIHETSVASIPAIIASLRDRGFTFVTVSELLELSDMSTQIGKKCYRKWDCR